MREMYKQAHQKKLVSFQQQLCKFLQKIIKKKQIKSQKIIWDDEQVCKNRKIITKKKERIKVRNIQASKQTNKQSNKQINKIIDPKSKQLEAKEITNKQSIKKKKQNKERKQQQQSKEQRRQLLSQSFNILINQTINQPNNRALSSQERNLSTRKQTIKQTKKRKKKKQHKAKDILISTTKRKKRKTSTKSRRKHQQNKQATTTMQQMEDQAYYLQHPQQTSQQGGAAQGASSANYQSTGMTGYPQSHQMSHIPYQNPHAPYPNHMTGPIDYSVHPSNPPPTGPYHPSASSHYPGQLHHGYSHPSDPYMQQAYSQGPYDYDPTGQIGGLYYGTPSTVPLSSDPTGQIGSNGQPLQGPNPYATYPSQLPPPGHYQQNLGLDPNTQQPYGQYHPHHSSHHHPGAAFGTTPGQPIDQNYMAFGQQSQYHGPPGNGYIPFSQPLPNGQLHHHNPYGLIQNQNQIGIIDQTNQTRPPQSSIGKASIKNEEQAMENELHLINSLGDSQSQQEDKIKQGGSNYLIPSQYDQQPPYPYYLSSQSYGIQKKDDLMGQNQYFQGYPQYPTGQYPPGSQQSIPSLQNAASSTSIKDKDDPSKRQPNSPGRRKTIKKGSPTGNTEPSSPASPRGRKRKNTAKLDQPQPESTQNLNQGIVNQQQQQQFGLHLVKVTNQDQQKNMGYPGQPYYQPVNALGKVMIDPNTQHISGIDQNSLQRLKELPTDFNMNEFTAVYDDQKQIGSISKEERKQKIKNYQDKRKRRSWQKKISYDVRKKVADGRLRVKGRFVTKKQAMEMLSINGKEEDYTMDQLKEMLKLQGIQANGGEEDSKSPTLPKKKNQSQPGTIVSLKPGDDDDEEGYGSGGEVHSEELPPSEVLPIIRGKSCENIPNKDDYFQGQGDFNYQNMVQGSLASNNTSNNNSLNENQLHLKLEQKEIENKQLQQNAQQFQQQQLQNQQSYSSKTQSQSQSPVRSPKKQNNSGGFQNNNNVKFMEQNQGHQIQNINQIENSNNNIKNVNGHSSYADLQNGESPQHSQNNILSQEMADQFGNLNIKSPDQKQKIMQQKNNPQLLNLNQTEQQFFGNNQASQNYNLYNQQQYNGNNAGYPIHQQQ